MQSPERKENSPLPLIGQLSSSSDFLRGVSSSSEFSRRTSTESCTDFLTELEWEASLAGVCGEASGCNQEKRHRSANTTLSNLRSLHLDRNAGSPVFGEEEHQEYEDETVPVSESAHPPISLSGVTAESVFASTEVLELNLPNSQPADANSKYLRCLLPHVLIFTQRPFNFLEGAIEHNKRALVKQAISVVFHSAVPLDILLHRRFVAALVLLLGALQAFFAVNSCIQKLTPVEGKAFRFSPLELKSGAADIHHPNVEGFGVFIENQAGCLSQVRAVSSYIEGKHHVALFDAPVQLAGFSVTTGGPSEHDPVRFTISMWTEHEEWEAVAHQHNWITFSGERRPGAAVQLPTFRGEATLYDLRAMRDWPWIVGRVGGYIPIGVGLAVLGASGLPVRAAVGPVRAVGRPALYAGWTVGGLAMLAAGVSDAVLGHREGAAMWLVYGTVFLAGTAALCRREQSLIPILLYFGVSLLVADVVCHGAVVGRGAADVTVSASHGLLAGCMLLGWVLLWLKSRVQHRAVTRVLATDKAAYLEAWRELCSHAGGLSASSSPPRQL